LSHNYFRRPYGIYVIAVWALILGLQDIVRLIYTLTVNIGTPPAQLHVYQWASAAFSLAFVAAAIGVWQRKNWGRQLFLVAATLFFIVAIVGIFSNPPPNISAASRWGLTFRYAVSIAIPWIYLNLSFVKQPFLVETEDITTYD